MIGFEGIDPAGLERLANAADDDRLIIEAAAGDVIPVLQAHDRWSTADRVSTALAAASYWLGDVREDLAWRARAIAEAQQVTVAAGFPESIVRRAVEHAGYAVVAPIGLDDLAAGFDEYRTAPPPWRLESMTAVEVRDTFARLSPFAASRLVLEHPAVVANLAGAPPRLRYQANRILMGREITRLEAEAASLEAAVATLQAELDQPDLGQLTLLGIKYEELEATRARIETFRMWAAEERRIILFDPEGDGRVAEVFGDLAAASHVAVVVPGITNTVDNFGPPDGGGFRENAANLFNEAAALNSSVATIAWLGYDTPGVSDAVLDDRARDGYRDLIDFVAGLGEAGAAHVTVIGHSYGSFLTGMAAAEGLPADDVVFVGSPGVPLDHAADAILKPEGEVWAGLATADPIGAGVDLKDPWLWVLGPGGKLLVDLVASGDTAVKELWHGRNPVHDSFGANQISTDGASGHSEYFGEGTESLENLAEIAAGLDPQVDLVGVDEIELAPGGGFGSGGGGGGSW